MVNVQFCKCGSPLSNYDVEHHGNCHDCRVIDSQELIKKQYEESVERKRLEKLQREADIKERQDQDNRFISQIAGKIVESAKVTEWHDYESHHPRESVITFTDGSCITHRYEDYGTREYPEHHVDIDITPCNIVTEPAGYDTYAIWNIIKILVPSLPLPDVPTEEVHMEMIRAARKDFIRHIHGSIELNKEELGSTDPA